MKMKNNVLYPIFILLVLLLKILVQKHYLKMLIKVENFSSANYHYKCGTTFNYDYCNALICHIGVLKVDVPNHESRQISIFFSFP